MRRRLLANVVISLLLAGLGWCLVQWRELLSPRAGGAAVDWQEWGMDGLQRLSYDLPFRLRDLVPPAWRGSEGSRLGARDVVIVYMDEEAERRLGQPPNEPWDRTLHARLVRWLARDGARAVIFDVVFDATTPADAEFAAALAAHGRVFLGSTIVTNRDQALTADEALRFQQVGIESEKLLQPAPALRRAARGVGLLLFRPVDVDYGVRRLFPGKARPAGLGSWPAVTWRAAAALGAPLPGEDSGQFTRRWLNPLGPAGTIPGVGYHRVLSAEDGLEPGYFKDKIVFVGARSQVAASFKKMRDEFETPWSRFRFVNREFTPGVEIHATILLNLLHREWLERVPLDLERWLVVCLGLVLGGLRWLRPWRAGAAVGLAMLLLVGGSAVLQWHGLHWWNWAVPAFVQLPAAFGLAVASRYYLEERERRQLRQAFGLYLSPELATQIADRRFTLAPGGEKVEATLLFTDLEGFTTLSEKLGDSARLGQVLRDYFTRTTDEILAENGTVIKFIGDAVYAAWGAPLPQPDHPERAVRAAWRLSQVAQLEVPIGDSVGTRTTLRVRTRVGIHTGEALAGNLGSARRFDYTLIGDAVNFASRLEGANKPLGTSILLSDDTAQRLGGRFLLRRVGALRVKGKDRAIAVHELLGDDPAAAPPWLAGFAAALRAWEAGDLATAQAGFAATEAARVGGDGPSRFYLGLIPATVPGPDWDGSVTLTEK
jgi:adenylate cyclase